MQNDFRSWFDPDPKKAEVEIEKFRCRLIFWFRQRGCKTHEDCEDNVQKVFMEAMKTLANRPEILKIDPKKYITGVAKMILNKYWENLAGRSSEVFDSETITDDDPQKTEDALVERMTLEQCFERCMKNLDAIDREIIKQRFLGNKHYTQTLAPILNLSQNAIRIRKHRLNEEAIFQCVQNCLKDKNV